MVVAVNGKFHSEEGLGTVEKLVALRPEVRVEGRAWREESLESV